MQDYSYFIIDLGNQLYGMRADWIEEVLLLPAFTPVLPNPHNLVGIIDLRGDLLPIIDLNLSLSHSPLPYQLSDKIIVLNCSHLKVGIIVNQIYGEQTIASEAIRIEYSEQEPENANKNRIIAGIVATGNISVLNHPEDWIEVQQILLILSALVEDGYNSEKNSLFNDSKLFSDQHSAFFSTVTSVEKEILLERANSLKRLTEEQELADLKPMAIVALGNYLWGIGLEIVREFVDIQNVIPVPCCPNSIIGNMSLRGEILTLVDLRTILNLPQTKMPNAAKAIVVEVEDMVAGILVEEVRDAMFLLNPKQRIPAAIALPSIHEKYLQGAVPYDGTMLGILNLPKLLLEGELTVDEVI
jgi:purine-binding chemotaxis protein CheW